MQIHFLVLLPSSTAVVQLTVNQLVVGSIPTLAASFISLWRNLAAFLVWDQKVKVQIFLERPNFAPLVKWYNIGFVIRGRQFDSV